jgi:Rrf2 family protein
MKISTKGRYALRLMLDLALYADGQYVSMKEIAGRQNISVKYLEQIISLLSHAGFVKSVRGSQGGYQLAKKPCEYTVGSILRLTEGSLAPVSCLDDETNQCERAGECLTLPLWKKLYAAVRSVVDQTTLQDLLDGGTDSLAGNFVI